MSDLDAAARTLLTRESYADPATIDAAAQTLRDHSPIHRVEHPDYPPLWVLTRHTASGAADKFAGVSARERAPLGRTDSRASVTPLHRRTSARDH